jgi:general secretion pathway protein K
MNDRGVVLITVLWVILILSLISFSLASAVRGEMNESRTSFDSDRAFFMARGAAEVIYRSFVNKQELPESSRVRRMNAEYVFTFDSGEARVQFESAGDRIDLNAASDILLGSMFDSLGASEQLRNQLVDSILDWRDSDDIPHLYGAEVAEYIDDFSQPAQRRRPRNAPFESIDEVLFVKNVTSDLFYGALRRDAVTGEYRRVPGLRDLVTIQSGSQRVNPNRARREVIRALPAVTDELADMIIVEREQQPFANTGDIIRRVPGMFEHAALTYMTFEEPLPSMITARAQLAESGVSRTVRILFRREEKIQFISFAPLLYRRVDDVVFDRWQYE